MSKRGCEDLRLYDFDADHVGAAYRAIVLWCTHVAYLDEGSCCLPDQLGS